MGMIMNHIRMFFTVEIEKTGRLAAIGNFLLTPPRALFNGKVVRIKDKNNIAKVSAYTYSPRVSKQDEVKKKEMNLLPAALVI